MIKAESWGRHPCFDGDLRRRMVAFLGLASGEGSGEAALGRGRKRRSRRGPSSVVAETLELEEQKGNRNVDGGTCEKSCVDCGSTKTPLWRGGPAGPKTLCNACGIRCRKMRRKGSNGGTSGGGCGGVGEVRREEEEKVMRQRQRKKQEALWLLLEQSRKFRSVCGEEEADAAVLLMALSTGIFLH